MASRWLMGRFKSAIWSSRVSSSREWWRRSTHALRTLLTVSEVFASLLSCPTNSSMDAFSLGVAWYLTLLVICSGTARVGERAGTLSPPSLGAWFWDWGGG